MTSGSSNCYWTPTRLTIRTPHAVRIDMRLGHAGSVCLANLVYFPVAVSVGRGLIDAHRPLTVRLAYEIHYHGEGSKRWHRTVVAPPPA